MNKFPYNLNKKTEIQNMRVKNVKYQNLRHKQQIRQNKATLIWFKYLVLWTTIVLTKTKAEVILPKIFYLHFPVDRNRTINP